MNSETLARATWRKSSFSAINGGSDDCVEVAALDDDRIAVRNSKHPDAGVILFTRTEMRAFLNGVKHREFDDLTIGR